MQLKNCKTRKEEKKTHDTEGTVRLEHKNHVTQELHYMINCHYADQANFPKELNLEKIFLEVKKLPTENSPPNCISIRMDVLMDPDLTWQAKGLYGMIVCLLQYKRKRLITWQELESLLGLYGLHAFLKELESKEYVYTNANLEIFIW